MSFLGFVYLFFFNILFRVFSGSYAFPDYFYTPDTVEFADIASTLFDKYSGVINSIYNIFAWINVFIDLDFLFNLLFLTLFYYGLKLSANIAKRVLGSFK